MLNKQVGVWKRIKILQRRRKAERTRKNRSVEVKSTDLGRDVLLELQLLLQGLQAVLGVHSPQHLVLQLLLHVGQADVQLGDKRTTALGEKTGAVRRKRAAAGSEQQVELSHS